MMVVGDRIASVRANHPDMGINAHCDSARWLSSSNHSKVLVVQGCSRGTKERTEGRKELYGGLGSEGKRIRGKQFDPSRLSTRYSKSTR